MNNIPFTTTDVSRVADLLNDESWYLIGLDADVRGVAVDMLHRMTEDGHPARTVSPLLFRGAYGTAALRDLITDNIFDPEDDTGEEAVGDICATGDGLSIVTPHGRWELADEEVLTLIQGLSSMLKFRLTVPWSEDDESTILSRGRQLRRPTDLTAELATIGDTYA